VRTRERLNGLRAWLQSEVCEGRKYKARPIDGDIRTIIYQKPRVFLGWAPRRPGQSEDDDPISVLPSILLMPSVSKGKLQEERRFDKYRNIQRPKDLGQTLAVQMLFGIYEPGTRLPGFSGWDEDSKELHIDLIREGTEEGLFTLYDWVDDCITKLLGRKAIPNTDLFLNEETVEYSPYTDRYFIVDKRPCYYAFVNAEFWCYADEGPDSALEAILN